MSALQLQDKVILITGAAGRLGRAAASLFIAKGAIVVGTDICPIEQSPELLRLQEKHGDRQFCFIRADASEEEEVRASFLAVEEKFGRLDGTFHNAYKQAVKPVLELPLDEWNAAIKGSLTSTYLVCKYSIALMISSGGGAIVNTSSVLSQTAKINNAAYGAAKAGMNQLTKVIALEYAKQGIRANVLLPGDFKVEEDLARLTPEARKAHNERFLLGRTGTPEELAELAAYLLSDAAAYMTGSLICMDGGYSL
ncbi:SDR family NAD(P)-dependent oxidoreductase [Paenibacillus sp. J2TS4]|uniref:SDR family NAD(P)-dependent oxidoreductase n=1 Tax=Paenibacillus sp. J2TS4 TaxID=2807194 RepID=UPI001B15137B|nr:SDR family oxidoreductase [Paenibacillus sp. J2TS4]GIP34639.1 short-chain dehydrogenase [Paenibacillus sp. J2TS4]